MATTMQLRIDNMHCGSCVRRVMQTLSTLPETQTEEVQVGSARIRTSASAETVQQALSAAGYPAQVESAA
jgi:copper chaperone CopZ